MELKHSVSFMIGNMGYLGKIFVWMFISLLVVAAIGCAIYIPAGNALENKAEIVEEDEFEGGKRKILNFGHTVGHAIEKLSNYEITHGRAVAVGMYIMTNALVKSGKCEDETFKTLLTLLNKYNLSYECPYSPQKIKAVSQKDKKADGEFIDIVEVTKTGESRYRKVKLSELEKIEEEGILR